ELMPMVTPLPVGEGFSGQAVATGQPVVSEDIAADPRLTRSAVGEQGYHALVSVPLVSSDRVLGALFLLSREQRLFSRQDLQLLDSIGHQIGVAVENVELYRQTENGRRELEALYQADEDLYRSLDLDEVLQALVDVAVHILKADKSSLVVWDEKRERLWVRATSGFRPETIPLMSVAPGEGVMGQVALTGEAAIVEDATYDPRVVRRVTEAEGIRSFMNLPIKVGGQVFGVFNVNFAHPRGFGADEQRLFNALAQRAALVIRNAQLYEQAQRVATVEERQRLARELHDAVTQTLFSASLIAEVLPRLWERNADVGRQRLEELRQLTRGALAEMRTLLLELRPSALMEATLDDLLRQLAEATHGRGRVPVEVTVEGEPQDLPPDVKVALYRIAQEALNNVVKHAAASRAQVSLQCDFGQVALAVRDDGGGFDPHNPPPDSLGLSIMRERAAAISADLRIESEVGQGTLVSVCWQDPHLALECTE
ncbi:MAG: GAF domain-containing protein, partial [Chloroflexi bacterium]|nr:GAF domain-containing protein [Chloroflexota bacterium]